MTEAKEFLFLRKLIDTIEEYESSYPIRSKQEIGQGISFSLINNAFYEFKKSLEVVSNGRGIEDYGDMIQFSYCGYIFTVNKL